MTVISAHQIVRHYANGRGVGPVSLHVGRGEMLGVAGASGSGKSTLLALLGLVLTPDAGSMTFDGRRVDLSEPDEVNRLRRTFIGMVAQDHGLLPFLSTWENVALGLGTDLARHRHKAISTLHAIGLTGLANAPVADLSGGERGRVAVARALIRRPRLVLADEPTGNLDPKSRDVVIGLLQDAAEDGAGVIIATHDEKVSQACSSRVRLAEDGRE